MITYDVSDGVATVTIDDPERRNPLSNETMHELAAAIDKGNADSAASVIVITGAGDRAFSAGGDLAGGFVDDPLASHGSRSALAELFMRMRSIGKPIIGRINGAALGGGLGLAVACDITVASSTARFGTPEIGLGLWPMMISTVLADAMPRKQLLDMMLTGKVVSAPEALDLGLVTRVVPPEALDDAVQEVVDALQKSSPSALALGKRSFYSMVDMDADTALDHLQIGLTASAASEDAREGVTAFLEKRTPDWSGA